MPPLEYAIDAEGRLPLPWLGAPLAQLLAAQRGHALLLRIAPGAGAFALGLALAQSRLCEAPAGRALACGHCASCRMLQAQTHPDLFVLLPETLRRENGWLLADDRPDGEEAKRKPSRQIRIDEVRALLDWVTKTAARGRGKVVLIHPCEALNAHAASALLKTVEEPPAGTRLVLTCSDVMHVLPTVRSRCQHWAMPPLALAEAAAWLEGQGVQQPQILLAACDGQPLEVLAWHRRGVDAAGWAALPRQLASGAPGVLAGATVGQAVDALLKLCHDTMVGASGGGRAAATGAATGASHGARYFPQLPRSGASLAALLEWRAELVELAKVVEHPWHEGLAMDALLSRARQVLANT